MEPFLGPDGVDVFIVVGVLSTESERLLKVAGDELIAGTRNKACGQARCPRSEFTVFDSNNLAAEDVHSIVVPQLAESAVGDDGAVAEGVNAACVTKLAAVGEVLSDIDGLDVTDDLRTIDEVVTKGRMREEVAFFGIDHVGGGRDEPAGLAFKGEVLGVDGRSSD